MSSTIIFTKDNFVSNYYESVISNVIDTSFLVENNIKEVKEIIVSNNWDLIIIDYNHESASEVIEMVHELKIVKPNIITANKEKLWEAKKKYKSQTLCQYIATNTSIDLISTAVTKMIRTSSRRTRPLNYCKVNINFFYSTKEIFCDVYLQLKDQKFIKLFNRYDEISYSDLQKYKDKNVNYLYVKEKDFKYITKQLVKHLSMEDEGKTGTALSTIRTPQVSALFSIQLQETVAESIGSLGLNQDAVEITSAAIANTIDLVNKTPKVYDLLKGSISGENYISEHSFLTSFIACAACNLSDIASEENTTALVIASFFHDIAINDCEKAKIQSEDERDFKTLGIVEQDEIRNHPKKAVEIISEIEGIPKNAITVILQHHETYDGRGFPRGIDYKKISPLSTIFNLSHELCLYIYESGHNKDNLIEIIEDMKQKYPKGHHSSYLDLIKRVLIQPEDSTKEEIAS